MTGNYKVQSLMFNMGAKLKAMAGPAENPGEVSEQQ